MSDNNNILNNIDRTQTWVDVETVAKLKGITKRGVRLSLNQNKYEYNIFYHYKYFIIINIL